MDIAKIYQPIARELQKVEERLGKLKDENSPPLKDLVEYILNQGGKRMRPAVTLLIGRAYDTETDKLLPMATAVELFHTATLVHDDTIDRSPIRRGKPTINNLWGGGRAVLFGDYLFAIAAELASTTKNLRVVTMFAETLRTVSCGELKQSFKAFDLSQSRQRYYESIANKTASLFVLATESAAVLSGASDEGIEASRMYGYNIGMAFQIVDDILDFVGVEEELGKPVGADLLQGVVTLPVILAIEQNPGDERVQNAAVLKDDKSVMALLELAAGTKLLEESYNIASDFCTNAAHAAYKLPEGKGRESLIALTEYVTERRI